MRSNRLILGLLGVLSVGCTESTHEPNVPSNGTRSYMMGFSAIPPRLDINVLLQALDIWTRRADAAIMHVDVPWAEMLAGTSAEDALRKNGVDLEHYYRSKNLKLIVMIDVTNGLARDSEAPALVAAHRSITEPAIQQLYRNYVHAMVTLLHPDYLGLAAETNLIRAIAPRPVYDAVVKMTNDVATEINQSASPASTPPLYVSVQVEVAWGKLGQQGSSFVGIDQDMHDFPFLTVLGLSSYPYLGGFKDPDEIPLEYYTRVRGSSGLPVMVVEGGWPSASAPGIFTSSNELQSKYLTRQSQLLDDVHAIGIFQLSFTDLDISNWPPPVPAILPLFSTLGLVDANLQSKPSLTTWDKIFARRLVH
jgi:hypothetical protein